MKVKDGSSDLSQQSTHYWYSKKQNSVETSTFGSEFTALKTGIEMIKGL